MAIELQLDKLSREEKLGIMEALWLDLSRDSSRLESPAWHEEALRETEARAAAGLEKSMDWETAKRELRKRFE